MENSDALKGLAEMFATERKAAQVSRYFGAQGSHHVRYPGRALYADACC